MDGVIYAYKRLRLTLEMEPKMDTILSQLGLQGWCYAGLDSFGAMIFLKQDPTVIPSTPTVPTLPRRRGRPPKNPSPPPHHD